MSRGNHQESIFRDHRDREIFLDTLCEACAKTGWLVHAFVLMDNHYHLLLETPHANLVVGMKWLQGTYTQRFNVRHKLWGHLFQGRYKALPVEAESGDYFSVLCSYIHLNPARAKLFDLEKGKLSDFSWSSYPLYLESAKRPDWLRVDRGLNASGLEDTVAGRNVYRQIMQKRVREIACSDCPYEVDARWAELRRGWFCGGDTFRKQMLDKLDGVIGGHVKRASLSGEAVQLHDEGEAERLVCEALDLLKLDEKDLSALPKGAEEKKAIAARVKERTHVSNQWIVSRLSAGHAANVSRYMADVRSAQPDSRLYKLTGMLKCED
ncbi:transposase [Tichowtungia aerotolerans]|uniref:Transposase n=2 Tax=Tichowtungia aerotolerans TaxID=2697043 RepID=A0A6P1M5E4_9BACT|nr:transposase [Tichowtungia aerotolerans]QHI69061.1 transposase [Tichowtungia aerotolerans]